MFLPRPLTFSILALCFAFLVGCGGGDKPSAPQITDPTHLALEKIGDAYIRANGPPKSKADLLPILKHFGKPDEVLKSPNDGQEFIIVYGVELRMLKATGNDVPVVAFEKSGKGGKRYVLRGRNSVSQLSDSELRAATFPAGYKFPF